MIYEFEKCKMKTEKTEKTVTKNSPKSSKNFRKFLLLSSHIFFKNALLPLITHKDSLPITFFFHKAQKTLEEKFRREFYLFLNAMNHDWISKFNCECFTISHSSAHNFDLSITVISDSERVPV